MTDEQIITAILASKNNETAAMKLGIAETTIYSRMRKPEFQKKLSEAKTKLLEAAADQAKRYMKDAVSVMVSIMRSDAAAQTRLNAAEALLRNGIKLTEVVDVEKRLDELERKMAEYDEQR